MGDVNMSSEDLMEEPHVEAPAGETAPTSLPSISAHDAMEGSSCAQRLPWTGRTLECSPTSSDVCMYGNNLENRRSDNPHYRGAATHRSALQGYGRGREAESALNLSCSSCRNSRHTSSNFHVRTPFFSHNGISLNAPNNRAELPRILESRIPCVHDYPIMHTGRTSAQPHYSPASCVSCSHTESPALGFASRRNLSYHADALLAGSQNNCLSSPKDSSQLYMAAAAFAAAAAAAAQNTGPEIQSTNNSMTLQVPVTPGNKDSKNARRRKKRNGGMTPMKTPKSSTNRRNSVLSNSTKDTEADMSTVEILALPQEPSTDAKTSNRCKENLSPESVCQVEESSKNPRPRRENAGRLLAPSRSPRGRMRRSKDGLGSVVPSISSPDSRRKTKLGTKHFSTWRTVTPPRSAFHADLQLHSYMLYLWSAFHLLVLVFRIGFYPRLNNSIEARTSSPEEAIPRYGPTDWSFYEHLTVPVSVFIKQSVVWAVGYALLMRAALFFEKFRGWPKHIFPRVYGLCCGTALAVNLSLFIFGGMESKSVLFPDVWIGTIWEYWNYDGTIFAAFAFLDYAIFSIGLLVDILGLILMSRSVFRYLHSMYDLLIPAAGVGFCVALGSYFLAESPKCNSNDHHWIDFRQYDKYVNTMMGDSAKYPPLRFPAYVAMADGVKIAVDIYLPPEYYEGFKDDGKRRPALPTYLEITRYDRRMTAIWPFTMVRVFQEPRHSSINVWSFQSVQALLSNGYAVVVADTRGTGASEGHREVDFSAEELTDFQELVQWTKIQWWCNGKLGMGGISYDGMTGLQAASRGGVDAAMALFTPMDVIGDLLAPGGMVCSSFVRDYVGLTAKFEEEGTPLNHHLQYPWHYPLHVILGFITTFGKAYPVHRREHVAVEALLEHQKNWDMGKVVQQVEYLDDNITLTDGRVLPVASFGITEDIMAGLAKHKVSIYIAGGYCDSAIVRGSARLFSYMSKHAPESKPKMVLGPWTHSGRRNCSPYSGSYPCFEESMYLDIVRYFDCHLKGVCWGGIQAEKPVTYWQVGEEKWRFSTTFPPENLEHSEFHFSNQPLGADLLPVQSELSDGILMMNNTVIENLSQETVNAKALETYTNDKNALEVQKPMVHHFIHDLTQLTYIRFKRPGSHYLHYYRRNMKKTNTQKLTSHSHFLAKDSYVLQTKNRALAANDRRPMHHYQGGSKASSTSTVHDVVSFKVDYQATTGIFTRWLIAQHPFRMAINYGNLLFPSRASRPMRQRAQQTSPDDRVKNNEVFSSKLSFTTPPLTEQIAITGSPWVKFTAYVSSCTELSLFVYLEDVDLENGYAHYVTEGKVVASHRETPQEKVVPIGSPDVVYRSFTRRDYSPVQGSELVDLSLTLEPVAWTFQKGHALRISMAGADVDNFELRDHAGILPVLPDKWQIIVNDPVNFPALIKLPTYIA